MLEFYKQLFSCRLVWLGFRRPLVSKDLWCLRGSLWSKSIGSKFDKHWKDEKERVLRFVNLIQLNLVIILFTVQKLKTQIKASENTSKLWVYLLQNTFTLFIKPTNPKYDFWYWKYGLGHSKKKCNIQLFIVIKVDNITKIYLISYLE